MNKDWDSIRAKFVKTNHYSPKKITNISGFRGVRYYKKRKTFIANITGKHIHIGTFKNPLHAAMAYDIWAKEHYGEYALLNFISSVGT